MYAEVLVDIAHSNVDRSFAYSVPQEMELNIGQRVLVPFGASNKPVEGIVTGLSGQVEFSKAKIKQVIRVLENYNVLNAEQLDLAQWMCKKYNCLLVDAVRLMIPAQLRGQRIKEKHVRILKLHEDQDLIDQAIAKLYSKDGKLKFPKQLEVIELLQPDIEMPLGTLLDFLPGSKSAVDTLLKKGCLVIKEKNVFRRPYENIPDCENEQLHLLTQQQAAVEELSKNLGTGGEFLLHGVTGSGKTEVYMRVIQRCLDRGTGAIVLVPEIALTPQTVERFRKRFGACVAVLHSRLSAGERFDEWRRIRLGKAKVVVGARSAVFAPLEKIGLIVIDEEHEASYQSEMNPRYNALEVASQRCSTHGAVLLLGSATPSLESYHKAKEGRLRLIEMPFRINGMPLPGVKTIDMRQEILRGNKSIFSGELYGALQKCLKSGEQAILFINRRGYSTFISCRACGYVLGCPACDVSMTYHKLDNRVKCHYCGSERNIPQVCPQCGKPYLKYFGAGTEQVEEHLKREFPGVSTIRMDYDTTQTKDAHLEMLSSFAKREAQVLIGTQMIAKGLDFPGVTLVGVVAADASLFIPDYRSAERTFQLITQVAGRAGRDEMQGSVIVQTYSPGHPSVVYAAKHDYKAFYEYEILQRKNAAFPPFSVFIRALFTGEDDSEVEKTGKAYAADMELRLQKQMESFHGDELLSIAPSPAPIKRIKEKARYQVLIKLRQTVHTEQLVKTVFEYTRSLRNQTLITLEVNPQNML